MKKKRNNILYLLVIGYGILSLLSIGCHSVIDNQQQAEQPIPTRAQQAVLPSATLTSAPSPTHVVIELIKQAVPTDSPMNTPTSTKVNRVASSTPTALPTNTTTPWPTVTRLILPESVSSQLAPCINRDVSTDVLEVVTQQFNLPRSYEPADLKPLSDYFEYEITRGFNTKIREVIREPLIDVMIAMEEAGLQPSIISGYRSYSEQSMAWNMWEEKHPDRVAILSARPGYSEHQLGTTVDFGSPEIDHQFHVQFAETSEGLWLAENAHLYGFTQSYPLEAFETTGFKYEPWHYRYVGTEMALLLHTTGISLTEWQLTNTSPPCIP